MRDSRAVGCCCLFGSVGGQCGRGEEGRGWGERGGKGEGEWRGGEGGTDFSSSAGEAPSLSVTLRGG